MTNKDEALFKKHYSTRAVWLVNKLVKAGFKFKIKQLKDVRTYGGVRKTQFSVVMARNGVSVRISSRATYNKLQVFSRSFTGGYKKLFITKDEYPKVYDIAARAESETIIRKGNMPDPHKLPVETNGIKFKNYEGVSMRLEFPHNVYEAKVIGVTGITHNGNTSEEIIKKPGEDVWFVVELIWMIGGKSSNILYRENVYYGSVYAREKKHNYVPRVSPHPVEITGNDGLLIKAAVDKYMENE